MTPSQEGDHTLDSLSRMLADESVSRARALRLLGAALVGGLLASIPGGAKAAPLVCEGTTPQKCGKTCINPVTDVCCGKGGNANVCPQGQTCCRGGCCPSGAPICCRIGGGATCAVSVDDCENQGGHVR